ncbi:hypothetical protein OB236_36225 [Paenibacillus sp. WQ 127069]|uniref:CBM-cenC domain-containing protein n=2 Tax=Paenibacillus baimaensis TaxID=2982185 RepID=A0ABT2UU18_9BACL|nr:hypothetical protein [Paenibacillus sp. WQ 127069]
MIDNGGFEQGLWWATDGFSLEVNTRHGGLASAQVISSELEQLSTITVNPINAHDTYELAAWIKTSNVTNATGVSINVLQVGDNGFMMWYPNGQAKLIATGETQEWGRHTATISNLHPNTKYVKIYMRMDANAGGTAWFDDISLTNRNEIKNGGFENGLMHEETGGFGLDRSTYHSGMASAAVASTGTDQLIATDLIPVNPYDTYELAAWIKTSNVTNATGVSINVLQVGDNGFMMWYPNGQAKLIATGETQEWGRHTAIITNLHPNTKYLKIYLRMDANMGGNSWFDDISLIKKNTFTYNYDQNSTIKTINSSIEGMESQTQYNFDKNGNLIKKKTNRK